MEMSILFPSDPDKISEKDLLQLHPFSTYNSETSRGREVWAIVATGADGAIGKEGDLPWHLPEDLRHFKELTMGHPVIMGRHTWESLPRRPLPGRRNIVISSNPGYKAEGAEVFSSPEAAVSACREVPFIIGGEKLYNATLPFCTKVFMTEVDLVTPDADTFFPPLDSKEWRKNEPSDRMVSKTGTGYRFVTYVRE